MALQQLLRSQYLLLAVTSDLCQPGDTKSHKGRQGLATMCRGQRSSSASCSSSCLPLRGGHVSSSAVCSRSWTQPETTLKLPSSSLLR